MRVSANRRARKSFTFILLVGRTLCLGPRANVSCPRSCPEEAGVPSVKAWVPTASGRWSGPERWGSGLRDEPDGTSSTSARDSAGLRISLFSHAVHRRRNDVANRNT